VVIVKRFSLGGKRNSADHLKNQNRFDHNGMQHCQWLSRVSGSMNSFIVTKVSRMLSRTSIEFSTEISSESVTRISIRKSPNASKDRTKINNEVSGHVNQFLGSIALAVSPRNFSLRRKLRKLLKIIVASRSASHELPSIGKN
jgi:hypothetical protein